MNAVGSDVSRITGIDYEDSTAAASEDERGTQAGGSTADDDNVETQVIGHGPSGFRLIEHDSGRRLGCDLKVGGSYFRYAVEAGSEGFILGLESLDLTGEVLAAGAIIVLPFVQVLGLRFVFVFVLILLGHDGLDWRQWKRFREENWATEKRHLADGASGRGLFDIGTTLLAVALPSESFFGPALFTWFQVERVSLDFLDDVFLLDLSLETTQRAFERLAVLQHNFSQTNSPPSGYGKYPG